MINVKILKIRSQGMEKIPDLEINFDEKKDINLFVGHNGFGKTSLFMAIKTVLSGDSKHLNEIDDNTGKALNKSISDLLKIYKGDKKDPTATFELTYKVNDKIWKVGMVLDYLNETIDFNHTHPDTGFHSKHEIDQNVESYFKKEFIDLIFFDAQRVKHIFIRNSAYNPQACIEKFCGIDTIFMAQEGINEFEKNKIQEFKKNTSNKSLSLSLDQTTQEAELVDNNLKKRKLELKELKANKEVIDQKIIELDKRNEDLLNKYNKSKGEVDVIREKIKVNNATQHESLNSILENIISRPYNLSENYLKKVEDLMKVFDKYQIPEKDSIALFEQILKNEICICGHHIGEKEKESINEYRKDIAESNEMIGFLNSLKDFWKNTIQVSEKFNYQSNLDDLKNLNTEERILNQKLQNLLDGEDKDEQQKIFQEKQTLKNDADSLQKRINELETESHSESYDQNSIPALERILAELSERLDGIKEIEKIRNFKKLINSTLDEASSLAIIRISNEIKHQLNKKIDLYMPQEKLEVNSISNTLELVKGGASSGQKATIAYQFLFTLLNRTNIKFPICIDNPTNNIDEDNLHFVAKFLPDTNCQTLLFLFAKERDNFTNQINKKDLDLNHYITAFRKIDKYNKTLDQYQNFKSNKDYISNDCVISHNRKFFESVTFVDEES